MAVLMARPWWTFIVLALATACTEEIPDQAKFKYVDALPADGASDDADAATGEADAEPTADGADAPQEDGALDSDAPPPPEADADTAEATDPCAAPCDDQNPCTDDTCKPDSGCVSVLNAASCTDGEVCTEGDVCDGGACKAGPAKSCSDGNDCTADSCEKGKGCVSLPGTATACSDGDKCMGPDTCDGGTCKGGTKPTFCNDGNACTDNDCKPAEGCVFPPNTVTCVDDDLCTDDTHCKDGKCTGGVPTTCDDQDPCTTDACQQPNGCNHKPATGAPCDDKNPCTGKDACTEGKCGGQEVPCDDGNLCTGDKCNPETGKCEGKALPDGTTCTTTLDCGVATGCVAGQCATAEALWDKQFGGPELDAGNDVVPLAQGAILGGVWQGGGIDKGYVARFSAAGEVVWNQGLGKDIAVDVTSKAPGPNGVAALAQQADGTIGVAAWITGSGEWDALLVRLSQDGKELGATKIGGTKADRPLRLAALADGGWVMVGYTEDGGFGGEDMWLVRVKADSTVTFQKYFGQQLDDRGRDVAVLADGFALAGLSNGPNSKYDCMFVRTDLNGVTKTPKPIYFATPEDDECSGVVALPDGFLLAGTTEGKGAGKKDAWLIRTDAAGVKLWDKTVGGEGDDSVASVLLRKGEGGSAIGLVLAGRTATNSVGPADGWVFSTDLLGNLVFEHKQGGTGDDAFAAVRVGLGPQVAGGGYYAAGTRALKPKDTQAWLARTDVWGNKSCTDAGKCLKLEACFDDNPCTADACLPSKGCAFSPLLAGSACGNKKTCNDTGACL
jgi:hypothetical protein